MGDFRQGVPRRHHKEHAGLLKRLPQSADPEGDISRDRGPQFQPVRGEHRGSRFRLLLHTSQPEIGGVAELLENVQPFARKVRRIDQTPGKHVGIGHESAFTATFKHQHVVIEAGPEGHPCRYPAAVRRRGGSCWQLPSGR